MRELVLATIADQPDIEVVGVLEDEAAIAETVERAHPDFLIIGLDRSEERPRICDVLLDRFPHIRILAMAAERNSTICYWADREIRCHRVENSEAGVLSALRGGEGSLSAVERFGPGIRAN